MDEVKEEVTLTDLDTRGTDAPPAPRKRGRPKGRSGPRRSTTTMLREPYHGQPTIPEPKEYPFKGLTQRSCCDDCKQGKCVITGDAMCGNPAYGGLQPKYALQPKIVECWREAKKYMAMQATEKKYA